MAPLKFLLVALSAVGTATAFTPVAQVRQQQVTSSPTQLQETFGLGLGEDTYENQPDLLKGEQEYKQYVNRINEENMLNRKVRNHENACRCMHRIGRKKEKQTIAIYCP